MPNGQWRMPIYYLSFIHYNLNYGLRYHSSRRQGPPHGK